MEELNDTQRDELQTQLVEARRSLQATLLISDGLAAPVDLDQPFGRLSRMDAMQQQQMAEEQRRRQRLRLKQVIAALARVNEGSYGFCRTCEEPVNYKRLKARPETPFCVPCMSRMESR